MDEIMLGVGSGGIIPRGNFVVYDIKMVNKMLHLEDKLRGYTCACSILFSMCMAQGRALLEDPPSGQLRLGVVTPLHTSTHS